MAKRIAIVVSHPIQHFVPQYSSWGRIAEIEIKVFFASRHGLDPYEDKNFGRTVKWEQLVLDFPHEFLPGADGRALGQEIDCDALADALAGFSPDVVVVYGYSQPLQRRAIRWSRSNRRPLAMIADSELRGKRSWPRRLAKAIVLPKILDEIDVFLSVGDANESYYRNYGVADTKLVRCFFPIDVKAFDAAAPARAEARARVRAELGIPASHAVILMVGKLVHWKRQLDLVSFSNWVQGTSHEVTVVLAGSGPEEQALKARAAKIGAGGVVFAGFVSPAKLVDYYASADVYVHCSENEPHSLAISEAIYSGLPVVLSDRCGSYGPSDDVRRGLNGDVYPCGNVERLSSALMKIVHRHDLRDAMGRESERIGRANQALAHGRALMQALEVIESDKGS